MNALLWFIAGGVVMVALDGAIGLYRRGLAEQRRRDAMAFLQSRGLAPHLYLATIGEMDSDMRRALDTFAMTGYIIIDRRGEVVGKLCPTVEPNQRPRLRLVVSHE